MLQDGVRCVFFFFQAEDGIRDLTVTGVQTCALPISRPRGAGRAREAEDRPREEVRTVSAIALLMGLLVLSYLGSLLVGLGKKRGGLPSGVEFIGLGFIVGPHALGVLDRPIIAEFEPVVQGALGWLAFVIGLDFGRVEGRRVKTANTILGLACALLTGGIVGFAVWQTLHRVPHAWIDDTNILILAAGAGAVCAETASRHAVEWVQDRWNAKGPISRLLIDMGSADDLAP